MITTTERFGADVVRITVTDQGTTRRYYAVANLDQPAGPLTVHPELPNGLYDLASVGTAETIDAAVVVAQEDFCMHAPVGAGEG